MLRKVKLGKVKKGDVFRYDYVSTYYDEELDNGIDCHRIIKAATSSLDSKWITFEVIYQEDPDPSCNIGEDMELRVGSLYRIERLRSYRGKVMVEVEVGL